MNLSDITKRSRKAAAIIEDWELPMWKRLHLSLQAYQGMELSCLPGKVRKELEGNLLEINQVIAKYDIETFEDYEKIPANDLSKLLAIISVFAAQFLAK